MYFTFITTDGRLNCLETKKVRHSLLLDHYTFTSNGEEVIIPISNLISIDSVPNIPKIAFIPEFIWNKTIKPLLKDFNVIYHNENLYCLDNDCRAVSSIISGVNDEEIIIVELPLEQHYYNNF